VSVPESWWQKHTQLIYKYSHVIIIMFQSPMTPLADYKTPCWFAVINKAYKKSKKGRIHLSSVEKNNDTARPSTGLRCLPYAMIIGVSKSGTTDLFYRLSKHPEVFPSSRKEVRFWSKLRIGTTAVSGRFHSISFSVKRNAR